MHATRLIRWTAALALAGLGLAACQETPSGPVRISAIGTAPTLVDPNRQPVDSASAMLLDATAQGLVRFDAAGEIEPALAQSWIVSNDGRRYTFRLRRTSWAGGEPVTAKQVVERLQAAVARNSRNQLRPVLGAVEQMEAMTEQVLEIRLRAPRPNFLQLLAQPELAIILNNRGTGPYSLGDPTEDGALRLVPPAGDEDEEEPQSRSPEILLRGDEAPVALARFAQGEADFVTGGTLGDVPLLAAADLPRDRLFFDPVSGLFGLSVIRPNGRLADARFRHALAMAVDREAIQARFGLAGIQPRPSLLPPGLADLPTPAVPDWSTLPFAERQQIAARIVAGPGEDDEEGEAEAAAAPEPPRLRVALPESPGYRILFAHLRRDWRAIGVDAVAVPMGAEADLRLVDEVAPAELVSWYLLRFGCAASALCNPEADQMLENARSAQNPEERQLLLQQAERALVATGIFIPIAQPVRWSLRDERLDGFRPNPFARHSLAELVASRD